MAILLYNIVIKTLNLPLQVGIIRYKII
jgi:hypothetical protein